MSATSVIQKGMACALGVLCIAAIAAASLTFIPHLAGCSTFAVQSPSMAPQIPPGALVIVDESVKGSDVHVGDAMALNIGETDENVCVHRVINKDEEGGLIETKGDANAASDLKLVAFEDVRGKAIASIPGAGYLLQGLEANRMAFLCIALSLALASASLSLLAPHDRSTKDQEKGRACPNESRANLRGA